MADFKDLLQTADWKTEKHVPVIEAPDKIAKGQDLELRVSVGKEIAHPNTSEHHIAWIEVYFLPLGEKFPYQLGSFHFGAHGASAQGPNTSSVFTDPRISISFKSQKSGSLMAVSYCNIHGLWKSEKEIKVE